MFKMKSLAVLKSMHIACHPLGQSFGLKASYDEVGAIAVFVNI